MTTPNAPSLLPLSDLVDYLLGELSPADERRVEEIFFEDEASTRLLELIESIREGIRDLVTQAYAGGVVNLSMVQKMRQSGLTLREYRLTPGATVSCKAGPEDFVLVRLATGFGSAADVTVDVDFRDLETNRTAPTLSRPVEVDREADEILLIFTGEEVRSYPRSLWTLRVHGRTASGETEFGPFILDHTP
ncbi:MAG: hypothetical protein P8020_19255 [Acidobacteriota bacterium]|jgi:hypothetical protein